MPDNMFDLYIEDAYILAAGPKDTINPNCSLLELIFRNGKTSSLVSVGFRVYSKDLKKVNFQSIYTLRHVESEGASVCINPEYLDATQAIFTIKSGVEVPGSLKNNFRSYSSYIYKNLHEKIKSL